MDRSNHLRRAMLALGALSLLVFAGSASATTYAQGYHWWSSDVYRAPLVGCWPPGNYPNCFTGWSNFSEYGTFNNSRGGYVPLNIGVTASANNRTVDPYGYNIGVYQDDFVAHPWNTLCGNTSAWAGCAYMGIFSDQPDHFATPSYIYLNNGTMNGFTFVMHQETYCHELGHAVGLDHTPSALSCMYNGFPVGQRPTTITNQEYTQLQQLYYHADPVYPTGAPVYPTPHTMAWLKKHGPGRYVRTVRVHGRKVLYFEELLLAPRVHGLGSVV